MVVTGEVVRKAESGATSDQWSQNLHVNKIPGDLVSTTNKI